MRQEGLKSASFLLITVSDDELHTGLFLASVKHLLYVFLPQNGNSRLNDNWCLIFIVLSVTLTPVIRVNTWDL